MRNKGGQNKLVRIITTPIRVLGKAKDMYVRSITQCGYSVSYGNTGDAAGRFQAGLPRSYSAATSMSGAGSEDYAELVRAASARTMGNRIDVDLVLKLQQEARGRGQSQSQSQPVGLPKSVSVGMGRIDEDKPFDLNEGGEAVVPNSYPRSRSYAVGIRKPTLVL
ncbi:hypothetical protein HN51_018753 [Arachis hypogaea]|uniref:Uncharacterized protein n=2 Tax=Arachis TaxID=3817 RepID=A0A445BUH5_ARAHY|nr:uncharacterized protein LOC107461171 [Arachis duranensis]XP_025613501.1 uncharacterized protein LOC112706418 [Arachis hypogaea]QHO30395.1 uncharacterized protein DS421_8g232880 [Arachis hypogaea]RYR42369.1 hypothetical protein Ahy_A08g038838 [Arachis hypogaea]